VKNESLDPKDWSEVRKLGHQMVDDMMDFLESIGDQPVWKPIPSSVKKTYESSLPTDEGDINEIYNEFKTNILLYFKGNIHPRFWAWVQGTGTPTAVLADFLASAMNGNVTIGEHAAMYIDKQVIEWSKEMLGFPKEASGFLTSGGSMANFTGLSVARSVMTDHQVRHTGLKAMNKQMVIYCSTETHSCVTKGIEILGIGRDFIRIIPVDDQYEINTNLLELSINQDLSNGLFPFCIVANVGTVNTGAIDDLEKIRSLCDQYNLWMHVDGAFGTMAKLAQTHKDQLKWIEVADSVVFDYHKWMYMPYEVGCVLINRQDRHRNTFSITPTYLLSHEKGLAAGPDPLNNYGLELSRGFKALKVWMSLKEHGINKFARIIQQNIDQIRYFQNKIEESEDLQLMAPVPLNVICYRFYSPNLKEEALNALNKNILMELQARGIASPSSTILNGHYVIRCAHVNQRSTFADFDLLYDKTIEIGQELLSVLEQKPENAEVL
jgi:aromatic-L-amino-acid/L-tryptophan decarboxylase